MGTVLLHPLIGIPTDKKGIWISNNEIAQEIQTYIKQLFSNLFAPLSRYATSFPPFATL